MVVLCINVGNKGREVVKEYEISFRCYELKAPLVHLDKHVSGRHYMDMELRGDLACRLVLRTILFPWHTFRHILIDRQPVIDCFLH